jgi:hypothetical protein
MTCHLKITHFIPSINTLLFIATIIAIILSANGKIANDPGAGWHIATGQQITSTYSVPRIDNFLSIDRPWIADQWLSDLIFSITYSMGGWNALASLVTITFILTFFVILYRSLLFEGNSPLIALTSTIGAIKVAQIHFIVRPVVFSFLLFTIFLYLLRKKIQAYQSQSTPRLSLYLALTFILWANTHPSFIIGLILIFIWLLTVAIDTLIINRQHKNQYEIKNIILTFIVCVIATIFNPYGLSLHSSILNLGQSAYFMNYHAEWLSPNFDHIEGKITEFFIFSYIISIYFSKSTKSARHLFEMLSCLFLLHGALQAVRMLPYFMIAFTFVWSRTASKLINLHSDKFIIRKFPLINALESRSPWYIAGITICTTLAIIIPHLKIKINGQQVSYKPSPDKYPYEAIYYLEGKNSGTVNILAPAFMGGFITLTSKGKFKPILDDRNTLLGEDIYKNFHSAEKNALEMRKLTKLYNVDYLILPQGHRLIYELNQTKWIENGFEDAISTVFKIVQ